MSHPEPILRVPRGIPRKPVFFEQNGFLTGTRFIAIKIGVVCIVLAAGVRCTRAQNDDPPEAPGFEATQLELEAMQTEVAARDEENRAMFAQIEKLRRLRQPGGRWVGPAQIQRGVLGVRIGDVTVPVSVVRLIPADDRAGGAVQQFTLVVVKESFHTFVFGENGNAEEARRRLESLLQERIAEADRMSSLSEAEQHKLRLAGQGDMKRFFDRVEQKCQELTVDASSPAQLPAKLAKRRDINAFLREASPLRATMRAGPFGDESLFAKTLRKLVSDRRTRRVGP